MDRRTTLFGKEVTLGDKENPPHGARLFSGDKELIVCTQSVTKA